jgi:hypothetical protein
MLLLSCLSRTADETGACSLCQSTPALPFAVGSSILGRDWPHHALHLPMLHLRRSCLQRRTCIDTANQSRSALLENPNVLANNCSQYLRPATGVRTELVTVSLLGVRSMLCRNPRLMANCQIVPPQKLRRELARFQQGATNAFLGAWVPKLGVAQYICCYC